MGARVATDVFSATDEHGLARIIAGARFELLLDADSRE
jgi:hypothetical protein